MLIAVAQLHFYERACMRYRASPDQVALEFDPEKAEPLVDAGGDYLGGSFYAIDGLPAMLVPQSLRAYRGPPTAAPTRGTLFLHRRTSRGGYARVVVVEIDTTSWIESEDAGDISVMNVLASTSPPMALFDVRPPPVKQSIGWRVILTRNVTWENGVMRGSLSRRTRFYSGQPDPADPSRFTIAYEICGEKDQIDGELLDDGRVTLHPRRAAVLKEGWDILPTEPDAPTSRRPAVGAPASK